MRVISSIFREVYYYASLFKYALSYLTIMIIIFFILLALGGIEISITNFALFLALGYEPRNIFDSLAVILMFFIQTFPLMAFVEARTMEYDERARLMAQKMRGHLIIVGFGHLGTKISNLLYDLNISFVVITLPKDREQDRVRKLIEEDVPVIFGNAINESVLMSAGIKNAKSIILAMNDDMNNPIIAEKAKKLNPDIKVVARIYSTEMADLLLRSKYADEVLSTSSMSVAKYIISSYFDIATEIPPTLTIKISKSDMLVGMKSSDIEEKTGVKILAIIRDGDLIRTFDRILYNDVLIIFWRDLKSLKMLLDLCTNNL